MVCEYCGDIITNKSGHLAVSEFCKTLHRRRLVRELKRYIDAARKETERRPTVTIKRRLVK